MPGDPGDAVLGRGILFWFRTASDLPSTDGSGALEQHRNRQGCPGNLSNLTCFNREPPALPERGWPPALLWSWAIR
jgi:hypothetical protein